MSAPSIRRADVADAAAVARLLHDFNREFEEPTPPLDRLTARVGELLGSAATAALLATPGPSGVALLRLRPALWSDGLESYLAELYVVPDRRGEGIGRALLDAAIGVSRELGADTIDLCTSTDDVAARALYESAGFTNTEGSPSGPAMLYYEREL